MFTRPICKVHTGVKSEVSLIGGELELDLGDSCSRVKTLGACARA